MARRPAAALRRRPTTGAASRSLGPVTPERPLGAVLEFLRALWGVNHALESTSRKMKQQLGVTGPERMVVRLVGRYPGISAGDLARILHVHPSTLTGLLKRLVSRGILRRKADAGDGRRALFDLTGRGAVVDGVRRGTTEAAVRATLEQLPDREIRVTATVLEALQRTLEEGR
jgi:MarR family transcriptional regulator, organic hydroperoxide resistance regulator